MERHGAEGGEGGGVQTDVGRHARRQVGGDGHHLGVAGVAGAGAGDPVAGSEETLDSGADREHRSGRGVAERPQLVAPRLHLPVGGQHPFAPDGVEDAAHQIGPGPGGRQKRVAADLDGVPLGAGRDDREGVAHQDRPRPQRRLRQIDDVDRPAPRLHDHLLHGASPSSARLPRRSGSDGFNACALSMIGAAWYRPSGPRIGQAPRSSLPTSA